MSQPPPTEENSPPPTPIEHGVEVVLADNADPAPLEVKLSRAGAANHVRWSNLTAVARVVHFKAGWPFMEAQEDIHVAANSKSSWYTLTTTAPTSSPYEVTPELKPGGPPDEPAITAGP